MTSYHSISFDFSITPVPVSGTKAVVSSSPNKLFTQGLIVPIEISTASSLRTGQNPASLKTLTVFGVLDTGCTVTSIDAQIALHLDLLSTGVHTTRTAGGQRQSFTYVADVTPQIGLLPFPDMNISSCDLGFNLQKHADNPSDQTNFGMLIGRDMMTRWHITWHGPTSTVFISD